MVIGGSTVVLIGFFGWFINNRILRGGFLKRFCVFYEFFDDFVTKCLKKLTQKLFI